jgi:hypothetical protein
MACGLVVGMTVFIPTKTDWVTRGDTGHAVLYLNKVETCMYVQW